MASSATNQLSGSDWQADSPGASSPAALRTFQCPRCSSSFKRPEHLKRHVRSHDDNKRFTCSFCSKKFARSDILARHSAIHTNPARLAEPLLPESEAGSKKRRRACTECARAREKCTKGLPCARCELRNLSCSYPDRHRSERLAAQSGVAQSPASETDDHPDDSRRTSVSGISPRRQSTYGDDIRAESSTEHSNRRDSEIMDEDTPQERVGANFPGIPVSTDAVQRPSGFWNPDYRGPGSGLLSRPADGGYNPAAPTTFPSATSPRFIPLPMNPVAHPNLAVPASPLTGMYGSGVFESPLDFPINWLPANDTIDIDYTSILGFGISSSEFFPNNGNLGGPLPYTGADILSSANGSGGPGMSMDAEYALQAPTNAVSSPANTISTGAQSHNSNDPMPPSATPGGLYATSADGARAPCSVRSKRPSTIIFGSRPIPSVSEDIRPKDEVHNRVGFPNLSHLLPADTDRAKFLLPSTYETISHNFGNTCLRHDGLYPPFSTREFPPIEHLDLFIHLYFEHFNPILPIVHERTASMNDYWPLALALAAVGCKYTQTLEFAEVVAPMDEFLRRVLTVELEYRDSPVDNVAVVQAFILSHVSILYYGSQGHSYSARGRHSVLVELAHSFNLLKPTSPAEADASIQNPVIGTPRIADSLEARRKVWIEGETRRRLGYAIWLLDSMSVYHFGCQPLLTLELAQSDLPNEPLWDAPDSHAWAAVMKKIDRNPSLASAVQNLFINKQVKHDLGQFARVLILHGVYQEIYQVKSYHNRKLSSWAPSAQQTQAGKTAGGAASQSSNSNFSNWRNASLDCVDVLHWAANSTIAQLSGVEPPTVLHLHMSRIVLLAPYSAIRTLALSIGSLTESQIEGLTIPGRDEGLEAEHEILQWAQRDEHKARLCVLHCGCFLWHIRRFSTMAFYEPISVFFATLTIWAYSSYTSRATRSNAMDEDNEIRSGSASRRQTPELEGGPASYSMMDVEPSGPQPGVRPSTTSPPEAISQPQAQPQPLPPPQQQKQKQQLLVQPSPRSVLSSDPEPTFIRLDRPNDDEMVQLFVRSGRPSVMRAYITGVGDICSPKGPARILREGRKILNATSLAWGRTKEYVSVLEALERAMVERGGGRGDP